MRHMLSCSLIFLLGNKRSIGLSIFVSNDVLSLFIPPRRLVYALTNVMAHI